MPCVALPSVPNGMRYFFSTKLSNFIMGNVTQMWQFGIHSNVVKESIESRGGHWRTTGGLRVEADVPQPAEALSVQLGEGGKQILAGEVVVLVRCPVDAHLHGSGAEAAVPIRPAQTQVVAVDLKSNTSERSFPRSESLWKIYPKQTHIAYHVIKVLLITILDEIVFFKRGQYLRA